MKTKFANSLPKIEPLPGAVCAQWKRCGKANCKCANGMLHGPYYYRFWYIGGKQCKTYVKKADLEAVLTACSAHKRERQLIRAMLYYSFHQWRKLTALLKEVEKQ